VNVAHIRSSTSTVAGSVPPSESASERSRRPRAGRRNRSSIAGAGPRSAGRRVRPRTSPARRVRDRRARERTATGAVRTVIPRIQSDRSDRARETDRQVGSGRREAILTGRDSCFERRFHGWGSLEREINVWLPKRERERAVCTPEVGVPVVARGVGRGETADPEDHQRPSIEVTLDGRCEWSSGFRREWMEKSAPPSWQHGIATPLPSRLLLTGAQSRGSVHGMRDRRPALFMVRGTSGPALFAFEALPYVFARRCRAMVCETRGLAPAAPPPARATARRLTGLERYAASLYRAPLANHRVESVLSDPLADRNDLAASTGLVLIDDCLLERIVGRTRVVAGTY